ncbi:molybdopterin-dependent oxidoreductase [Chloroflexota bacterium]
MVEIMNPEVKRNNGCSITLIPTVAACYDCGGKCVIMAHVKDGMVIRLETDSGEEPQLKACLRGRSYRKLCYAPDRLKHPLKRTGARGEGKFERISWDEALDKIAGELIRAKNTYGCSAIQVQNHAATNGELHGHRAVYRLLNMFGGFTVRWGGASAEALDFASRSMYGTVTTGNTRDDLVNSRLIIMWGWDPARTIFSTNTPFYLTKAKEAGARFVCVDPRFTASAAVFANQWIPIRPGTDAAMLIAMAYVIIAENLHDRNFLDRFTIGFDKFQDYVTGSVDGVPKTPSWAEPVTGVPAATIEKLAREYGTTKPAALIPSWAPGRTAYGEQFHRAASTLSAMTGNVGNHGGCSGGRDRALVFTWGPGIPQGKNPVQHIPPIAAGTVHGTSVSVGADSLNTELRNNYNPHSCQVWDTMLEGKSGGFITDIKFLWVVGSNMLNQFLNINKGVKALNNLEFILVNDQFMTPTAKFADIVLPINTLWERNDIFRPWHQGAYYVYGNKLIDSLYESKTDFEACCELAPRLGITNYSDRTEDEWLRELSKTAPDLSREISDYDRFKQEGVHKIKLSEPHVTFKKQIEDPEHNPFPTPSGKIVIYSQRIADVNDPKLPPIPQYIESWESVNDPLASKYPLQLVSIHARIRTHSCFQTNPWLRKLEPHAVEINPVDAEARGVRDGDEVKVFNGRGVTILPAQVTRRIMPGVVCIPEGTYYNPDSTGADRGGNPNILTKDAYSPGGAWPINTCMVQIEKTLEEN